MVLGKNTPQGDVHGFCCISSVSPRCEGDNNDSIPAERRERQLCDTDHTEATAIGPDDNSCPVLSRSRMLYSLEIFVVSQYVEFNTVSSLPVSCRGNT